jgi:hypothetical protein
MPVSKPAWFVTNGKSRLQVQAEIENRVEEPVSGMNRGIGPGVAVAAAEIGQNDGVIEVGAAVVVTGGVLVAVLDVYSTLTGTASDSRTLGSE